MTASDIVSIVSTVAVTQLVCDWLSRRWTFDKEPYQRALSSFERAKVKRDKMMANHPHLAVAVSSETNNEAVTSPQSQSQYSKSELKTMKKIQRAQEDVAESAAAIAQRHTRPGFFGSLVFVILYRILSTEYDGRPVAVLPFRPWNLVRRISGRGLLVDPGLLLSLTLDHHHHHEDAADAESSSTHRQLHHDQACSFLFVYLLSTLSVKFLLHKRFGVAPPKGADRGVMNMIDAPGGQRALRSLGIDTTELNEARKSLNMYN